MCFFYSIKMIYAVVEICEADNSKSVASVPKIWLADDGKFIYWPPKNVGKHLSKLTNPEKTWTRFKCRIVRDNIGIRIL